MKINCRLNSFVKKKDGGVKHICKEFSYKNWAVSSARDLLCKIDTTNSITLKAGSRRPRTVRTEQNIEHVAEPICSQEDNPGSSFLQYRMCCNTEFYYVEKIPLMRIGTASRRSEAWF